MDADQLPTAFVGPYGNNYTLHDAEPLVLRWAYASGIYFLWAFGAGYGQLHFYMGEELPKTEQAWKVKAYRIPIMREISAVLLAGEGFVDYEIARMLGRPLSEMRDIVEYHGYSWDSSVPLSARARRFRSLLR